MSSNPLPPRAINAFKLCFKDDVKFIKTANESFLQTGKYYQELLSVVRESSKGSGIFKPFFVDINSLHFFNGNFNGFVVNVYENLLHTRDRRDKNE